MGDISAGSFNMPGGSRRVIPDMASLEWCAQKKGITLSQARMIFYNEIQTKISGTEELF
jgi:hypothetical protein